MFKDHAKMEAARAALRPPNKHICVECLAQAPTEEGIKHKPQCPAATVPCVECKGSGVAPVGQVSPRYHLRCGGTGRVTRTQLDKEREEARAGLVKYEFTLAERVALSLLVARASEAEWLEHRMEGEPYEFEREEISAALLSLTTKLRDDKL